MGRGWAGRGEGRRNDTQATKAKLNKQQQSSAIDRAGGSMESGLAKSLAQH